MEREVTDSNPEHWRVNPGAALRFYVQEMEDGPEHPLIDGRIEGLNRILLKADKLKPTQSEKLLMAAARVVNGVELTYGLSPTSRPVETWRPGVIDHFSLDERGSTSQLKRYGQVFKALDFISTGTVRTNDHGMRVAETTYVSPHFIEDGRRLVIVELLQSRDHEVALFVEAQPFPESE